MALSIAVVADAIVDELNNSTKWQAAFGAERIWTPGPYLQAANLDRLNVIVMVGGGIKQMGASLQSVLSKIYRMRTHEINITFIQNVEPENKAAIDALAAQVEAIADYYATDETGGHRKIANTNAYVTEVLVDPIVAPDQLANDRRFFSVLSMIAIETPRIAPSGRKVT